LPESPVYLSSLSELALGSRLKALSDRFYAAADEVYRVSGAGIESRWFPVMRFLWERGPATVTEVAAAIRQGVRDSLGQEGENLLQAVQACERALDEQPIVERILARHAVLKRSKVE